MVLKIAIQGEAVHDMAPEKTTAFILGLEAQRRGHIVKHYRSDALFLEEGEVKANGCTLKHIKEPVPEYEKGEDEILDLAEFDIILTRKSPPVDQSYLATSYILERLEDKVLFLNRPGAIRNYNAKVLTTYFPDFIVPYIIANSILPLQDFFRKHGKIVLKSLTGSGGNDIFKINSERELLKVYDEFRIKHNSFFMAQQYIPGAVKGDKRIIVFDGEPVCAILRVPVSPDRPANISHGATVAKCGITDRDRELCEKMAPTLKKEGLFFVGLDLLDGKLTEVNMINVGTVKGANEIYGINLAEDFWDRAEEKIKNKKS